MALQRSNAHNAHQKVTEILTEFIQETGLTTQEFEHNNSHSFIWKDSFQM